MRAFVLTITIVPCAIAGYILFHLYAPNRAQRSPLAKTRGYLTIASMFTISTISYALMFFFPAEFDFAGPGEPDNIQMELWICLIISIAIAVIAFELYRSSRPKSKEAGRKMAGW